MRMKTKMCSAIALAAFGAFAAVAAPIRLKSGEIDPDAGLAKSAAASFYAADEGVRVYLVQCEGSISPEWRESIEQAGGKILGYVPDNAYLVAADPSAAATLASQVKYAYLGDYRPEYKVSAAVNDVLAQAKTLKVESNDTDFKESAYAGEFVVSIFKFAKASDVAARIAALDGCVVVDADGDVVRARLSEAAVSEILSWPEVEWLEPYVEQKLFNNVAVGSSRMNVTAVRPGGSSGLGLTGKEQVVAVCDTGLDTGDTSSLHEDVRGRVTRTYCYGRSGNWSDPNGHGTHVSGSVMGNGAKSSGDIKGVAYEANLIFQSVLNSRGGLTLPSDLKTLFNQAYVDESGKKGARIHSNSWGASQAGYYSTNSRAVDQFMFEHPDMLIFFSAGNDGVDFNRDGVVDSDSIGSPATAKNCMTVGAAENDRTSGGIANRTWGSAWPSDFPADPIKSDKVSGGLGMAAFSSRGPCDDGRIKPDIVAPGTDILSLHSSAASDYGWGKYNSYYEYMGGTSMSTPLTAGAAVLVRQWLVENQGISNPDGATVKAVMLAGAKSLTPGQYGTGATREIPASYPNNVEGWGQVNLGNALANSSGVTVLDGKVIGHGETQEYKVSVNSAGSPLAIVMAYMDAPASLSSYSQLVNDLDLTVTTPSGATLYPNSRTSPDRVNNVEGVRIASAQKGIYTIKVKAYSVTSPMALAWTGNKANATRYSVAVNGATQSAALEVSSCFLSKQAASGSAAASFYRGETIYVYGRVHNPGSFDFTDGFLVKHELLTNDGVSKGSLEKSYGATIAAGGDYDIAGYEWSGLRTLSCGSYTYRFTLTAPGGSQIRREVPFEVSEPPSPLEWVELIGPSAVGGGSRTTYTCKATLRDGTVVTADPVWSIDSGSDYASIDQDGTLYAYAADYPRTVVIRASCTYNGVTRSGTKTVSINPVISLPVALDCPTWSVTNGGEAEWFGQKSVMHDSVDAAQSGQISHRQTSWFEVTVKGTGTLSFWYRVSTELRYDELVVSSGGSDLFKASGESPWQQQTIGFSDDGDHVVRFAYVKDVNRSEGEDAVYLDQLEWTNDLTPVRVDILGAGTVEAGEQLQLACKALMSDGTERDVTSDCEWTVVSGSAYAAFSGAGTLTALNSTVDRSVVVRASYTAGGVTKSADVTIVIRGVPPPPAAPVITRAGAGDYSAAILNWTAEGAGSASIYRIYRSETASRPSSPCGVWANIHTYSDKLAVPGVEYHYWVSVDDHHGNEIMSDSAVAYRDVQLTVGTSAVSFAPDGGATNLTVKSNADVRCSVGGDWLTASYDGTNLTIVAETNESEEPRTAAITLTAAESTAHPKVLTVTVDQAANVAPEQALPDLAFTTFDQDWDSEYALYTAASPEAAEACRLFDVNGPIYLRCGWGNLGDGVARGTVTNVFEVGRRQGDEESNSVDERDIELDVLTCDAIVEEISMKPGAPKEDVLSADSWTSLSPGVYIAKAVLNEGKSLEESDYYNNSLGFRFAVREPASLSEALDCTNATLELSATGDQWYGTAGLGYDGEDCAMTKLSGDGSADILTAKVSGAGTLSFVYKVATEASYDVLTFKDGDKVLLTDSGIGDWKQVSFDIASDDHVFTWTYQKDAMGSDGDDCVYLDQLVWTPARSGEPPADFAASEDGSWYVTLEWTHRDGATSYVVERAESKDGPWTAVDLGDVFVDWDGKCKSRDMAALGGVEYWYHVKAVDAGGESDWSDSDRGYRVPWLPGLSSRTVPSAGGRDAFFLEANCIWTAAVTDDSDANIEWLTLDTVCGTNDSKVAYRFLENITGAERSCTITIAAVLPDTEDALVQTFTVTQREPADNGEILSLNEATGCDLHFRNSDESPWFGQTRVKNGEKPAMRSAEISGNATSRVEVALARGGTLSFRWGISSDYYDKLYFCVGSAANNRQELVCDHSSSVEWQYVEIAIPPEGAVVAWEYVKDGSVDDGHDAGYVSEIVWTPATEEIVPPQAWFDNYPRLLELLDTTDLAVAAKMQSPGSDGSGGKTAADGSKWLVWMDYVCGTHPLKSDSQFRATITMENGVPKVKWDPKLDEADEKLRNYLIHGKRDLKSADWTPVAEGHESEFNFFKVSVEMQ